MIDTFWKRDVRSNRLYDDWIHHLKLHDDPHIYDDRNLLMVTMDDGVTIPIMHRLLRFHHFTLRKERDSMRMYRILVVIPNIMEIPTIWEYAVR